MIPVLLKTAAARLCAVPRAGLLLGFGLFLAAVPLPQDRPLERKEPRPAQQENGAPDEEAAHWIAELRSASLERRDEAFFRLQLLGAAARPALAGALEGAAFQARVSIRYLLDHEALSQEMVEVPAGNYRVGSSKLAMENPEREILLDAFLVDRYEVTNFMYYAFVRAKGHPAPEKWRNGRYPLGKENLPVTAITFDDAAAYARWAGKRLPTEEEWEVAASGGQGGSFPWGERALKGAANIDKKELKPAGSYEQDTSPWGCRDMAGNAAEWVVIDDPQRKTIQARKGAAFNTRFQYPVAYLSYKAVPYSADKRLNELGFRCVKDGGDR